MRSLNPFKRRTSKSESVVHHEDDDDEFHDSHEAMLHPDAHEEGGYGFTNKELLAQQRSVLFEIIKEMGKKLLTGHLNLINVSLPVKMFEPRSYLEKLTDNWVYPHFLTEAAHTPDPVDRLQLVMTWFIAGLQHSYQSWRKPFNPILGETFQANLSDGSTVAMEQVSHHPPVSAFQLRGPGGNWEFSGCSQPEVSFELKSQSVKTQARGKRNVTFPDGTKIEIQYPTYYMRGLLYTAMPRGDATGTASFIDSKNHLLGEVVFGKVAGHEHEHLLQRADAVSVTIHEFTWPDGESHDASQGVPETIKRRSLSGLTSFTSILNRGDHSSSQGAVGVIKGKQRASGTGNWLAYLDWNGVRQWTLNAEHQATWERPAELLSSDSRYRKDLLALAEGDLAKAQACKEELENQQRHEAKLRKAGMEDTVANSFRSISLGN